MPSTTIGRFIKRRGYAPVSPFADNIFSSPQDGLQDAFDSIPLDFGSQNVTEQTTHNNKLLEPIDESQYLARRGVSRPNPSDLAEKKSKRRTRTQSQALGQGLGMLLAMLTGDSTQQKLDNSLPTLAALNSLIKIKGGEDAADDKDYNTRLNAFYEALTGMDKLNQDREIANLRYGQEKEQKPQQDKEIHAYVGADGKQRIIFQRPTGELYEHEAGAVRQSTSDSTSDIDAWRQMQMDERREREAMVQLDKVREQKAKLEQALAKVNEPGDDSTKRNSLLSLVPELNVTEAATSDQMRNALIDALVETEKRGQQWQGYYKGFEKTGFDYYSQNAQALKQLGPLEIKRKKAKQELDRLMEKKSSEGFSKELEAEIKKAANAHDEIIDEMKSVRNQHGRGTGFGTGKRGKGK